MPRVWSRHWRKAAISVFAVLCCLDGAARAEAPSRAETLFNQGLENMRGGKYEQACPAIEESYKLDPLPGVLFTVAECEAAWGRIATALGHYDEFLRLLTTLEPAAQKKHHERRQIATEKMTGLAKLAPQLTVVVPAGAPAGTVIKRNGTAVDPLTYGVASSPNFLRFCGCHLSACEHVVCDAKLARVCQTIRESEPLLTLVTG